MSNIVKAGTVVDIPGQLVAPREWKRFPVKARDPGVYRDIPAWEYHQTDGLSGSTLEKVTQESAASCEYYLESREENPSPSLLFGELVHTHLLEPDKWDSFSVPGPVNPKTKKGYAKDSKAWLEALGAHPAGALMYAPDDLEVLEAMHANAYDHEPFAALCELSNAVEASFWWDCGITGLRCKGRFDQVCTDGTDLFVHDLKSTRHNVNQRGLLSHSIAQFGYYRKAAFYLEGVRRLFPALCSHGPGEGRAPDEQFEDWLIHSGITYWITFVSTVPPYGVLTRPLRPEAIVCGWREQFGGKWNGEQQPGAVALYAEALRTGDWWHFRLPEHLDCFDPTFRVYAAHEVTLSNEKWSKPSGDDEAPAGLSDEQVSDGEVEEALCG